MSNTVDQRIVEMQFNNKQFESGIQTSIKSLAQLEKGLNLDGATKGLSELDRATKSFSFAGLANSVDAIASKFTGLGILGVTTMQNLANSVYNTGMKVASSLTVEPIKTGFAEYETQINAVQTILANTQNAGKTLPDVTKALDELNAYADKTIYNFTEMTRNIGTFTAAGVDLDVATNSIQGIANLAAISGSTSQQASTAMYQLSQAMASGTVKLMDWNSVVNAGMGGQVFQDALKETARAHGIAIDSMIEKNQGFRNTLQEGWLTTEVLTETLEKFTATTEGLTEEQIAANREMWKARGYTEEQIDAIFEMGKTATDAATKVKTFTQLFDTLKESAQSGWTQSWEILIGDFEEAKELLTQISVEMGGIIEASALARNTLLQGWKDLGGRDDIIAGFRNLYEAICMVIEPAKEAFGEIFPPITIEQLKNFTQRFEDITGDFKNVSKASDSLKRTFKGLFAIVDIGGQVLSALATGFADILGFTLPIGGNLLDMTASLGDFLVELSNATRESGIFAGAMEGVSKVVAYVADIFEKLTSAGANVFEFFESISFDSLAESITGLELFGETGVSVIDKLKGAFEKAAPVFSEFTTFVNDTFGGLASAVSNAVQDGSLSALLDLANGGLLAGLITMLMKVADSLKSIADNASGFVENVGEIVNGVTDALSAMQNKLNAEALKSIAIAVGILAASLAVLSGVDQNNLGSALTAITAMFIELIGALVAVTQVMDGVKILKLGSTISAIKGLATAVLVLSAAMAIVGNLNGNDVAKGLIGIAGAVAILVVATQKLSAYSGSMMKGASSLIAFSIAVGVLALSLKAIGGMDIEAIGKGLLGLAGILAGLSIFMKLTDMSKLGISSGIGLMAFAVGIGILSLAIRSMGSMPIENIGKGLLTLIVGMTYLSLVLGAMPDNIIAIGLGLVAVSAGIAILSAALHVMGSLSLEQLGIGLLAMAGSLTAVVIAANMMKGSIGGAAAILVMAVALNALGVALKIMGSMSIGEVVTGLLTMAAALALIGGAAFLLGPLVPSILLLSAGILALGIAGAAAGAALLVFGAGMSAVAVGLTAVVTSIVASVVAIISAIEVVAEGIGNGIVAIANALSEAAPACADVASSFIQAIVDVIVNGITSISEGIQACTPAILELIPSLVQLGEAAAQLVPYAPAIAILSAELVLFGGSCAVIAAGVWLLSEAFEALGKTGLSIATALTDIYATINSLGDLSIDAVLSAGELFRSAGKKAAEMILEGIDEGLADSGDSMTALIDTMVSEAESASSEFSSVGESLAGSFSEALSDSLQNGVESATSTTVGMMTELVVACAGVITNSNAQFLTAGAGLINSLGTGANSRKSSVVVIVTNIASAMASKLRGYSFYNEGTYMVDGLINGINARKSSAVRAATQLGIATKNAMMRSIDAHSPSKDFEEIGMWADMGLANGLIKFSKLATNAATTLGERTIQPVMTMTNAMIGDLGSIGSAIRGTASLASALDSCITTEQYVTINHVFEDLTVKGVNDHGEFVAVADYSVESILTDLMRKGIRR